MTSELVTYARTLADSIRDAGVKNVTTKASAAVPPCVLIPPIPAREYDIAHGYTATWSIICLAPAPGDERAAEQLDELVQAVWSVVPLETADPVSYKLPTAGDPVPAYLCKFRNEVETH